MVGLNAGLKNFEDMFSGVHRISACDRRMDGQTNRQTDGRTNRRADILRQNSLTYAYVSRSYPMRLLIVHVHVANINVLELILALRTLVPWQFAT